MAVLFIVTCFGFFFLFWLLGEGDLFMVEDGWSKLRVFILKFYLLAKSFHVQNTVLTGACALNKQRMFDMPNHQVELHFSVNFGAKGMLQASDQGGVVEAVSSLCACVCAHV